MSLSSASEEMPRSSNDFHCLEPRNSDPRLIPNAIKRVFLRDSEWRLYGYGNPGVTNRKLFCCLLSMQYSSCASSVVIVLFSS